MDNKFQTESEYAKQLYAKVDRILKKKRVNAQEISSLIIGNMLAVQSNDFLSGTSDIIELPSNVKRLLLNKMSDAQMEVYRSYKNAYDWIIDTFNIAQGHVQAVQGGFYRVDQALTEAVGASTSRDELKKLGYILSPDDYDCFYFEDSYVVDAIGRKRFPDMIDVFELLLMIHNEYVRSKRIQPEEYLIFPLKEVLESETVKDTRLLLNYAKVKKTPLLIHDSKEMTYSDALNKFIRSKHLDSAIEIEKEIYSNGLTDIEAIRKIAESRSDYEVLPLPEITKWDFLTDKDFAKFIKYRLMSTEDRKDMIARFCAEFPEVVNVLLTVLTEKPLFEAASCLPSKYWTQLKFEWLPVKKNFPSAFRSYFSDFDLFPFYRPDDVFVLHLGGRSSIDETGRYNYPNLKAAAYRGSIESMLEGNDRGNQKRDDIKAAQKSIETGLYFINGYEMTLAMIDKVYGLPETKYFYTGYLESLDRRLQQFTNVRARTFYHKMKDDDILEGNEKQAVLDKIREYFNPFSAFDFRASQDAINMTLKNLKSGKAFTDYECNPIFTLCIKQ